MDIEPGRLLASGRAADVFDQGDGTVVRRYRIDHDTAIEARVMTWARDHGVPVPEVHGAQGPDLVMGRIDGPTMLEDLQRRPWRLVAHARLLARLQRQLAQLTAPSWLPPRPGIPTGSTLLHLDLHPMNVMLAPSGPVIIDWTNAAPGPAAFDAAYSYVLMAVFETSGPRDVLGQQVLTRSFARARGRDLIAQQLVAACDRKLADPSTTDGEAQATRALRRRQAETSS